MAKDDPLAERIRAALSGRAGVGEKHMFGGVCFTLDGAMACGTAKGKLMLRVGKDRHDEIMARKHVRPMDFTGRPLRGFVYVEPEGYRTAAALRGWLELALDAARAAPAKKGTRAAKAKPLPPKLRALADRAKQKRNAPPSAARRAAQFAGSRASPRTRRRTSRTWTCGSGTVTRRAGARRASFSGCSPSVALAVAPRRRCAAALPFS